MHRLMHPYRYCSRGFPDLTDLYTAAFVLATYASIKLVSNVSVSSSDIAALSVKKPALGMCNFSPPTVAMLVFASYSS